MEPKQRTVSLTCEGKNYSLELIHLLEFVDQSAGEDGFEWSWRISLVVLVYILCKISQNIPESSVVRFREELQAFQENAGILDHLE